MYGLKTEGIVVRSYDYGDGHRIVVLLTETLGKIKAVARGSRKMKSKFGASLEPMSINHLMLHRKPSAELHTVTGCHLLDSNISLRSDMNRYAYASIMSEGIDLLCADEDPDREIYSFFKEGLRDVLIGVSPAPPVWLFMFRLLKHSGYRLDFFKCSSCDKKIHGNMRFYPAAGSVMCRDCCEDSSAGWPVSYKTLTSIRKLSADRELARSVEKDIGIIIRKYIKYQYDKDLKYLNYIKIIDSIDGKYSAAAIKSGCKAALGS